MVEGWVVGWLKVGRLKVEGLEGWKVERLEGWKVVPKASLWRFRGQWLIANSQ